MRVFVGLSFRAWAGFLADTKSPAAKRVFGGVLLLSEEGAWVVIRVAAASGIWLWVFEVFCMHACMYVSMQVLHIYIYIVY